MDANVQPNDWLERELKPKINHWGQLGILIGLFVGGIVITFFMQMIVMATMINLKDMFSLSESKLMEIMAKPENFSKVVFMQTAGTLLTMAAPAFIFAKITTQTTFSYFGFKEKIHYLQILLVVAIAATGLVLSGGLGEVAKQIPLSTYWKEIADKMEATYESGVMIFTNMKTFGSYLFSLIMIAILPAIFEELLFRGALQKMLTNWFKQPHIAIIITAIIFSLVHFSFYGFFARMMLGMVLGYLYYYGKNIALNMLMHFINNGVAITAMYIAILKGQSAKEVMTESYPIWAGAMSLILMIALLFAYKKVSTKTI